MFSRCTIFALSVLLACACVVCADDDYPTTGNMVRVQLNNSPWEFDRLVGITFAANGQMVVWERGGKVWMADENGNAFPQPLLDIGEEIGDFSAQGMMGFALDPDFLLNGHVYLLYTVDRHHLLYFGTPAYDPNANEYEDASIARVTRYTATAASGFTEIDYSSRLVLIGESIDNGIPVLSGQHANACLLFGTDGSLLVSIGDSRIGTSYEAQAIIDGIITPAEDVSSYRAQMVDSYNGKILRINPADGDGYESNPFFDPLEPRAPRSRVWALGFRNPYRMALTPETGKHDPSEGDPGVIMVGDVGQSTAEELNVVEFGGQNFGWPIYEGFFIANSGIRDNLNAPNPLYDGTSCTTEFFTFRDLIIEDTLAPNPEWPNPCDNSQQIPPEIPTFMHTRPAVTWGRIDATGPTYVKTYNGNAATYETVDAPGSPTTGDGVMGTCSIAGAWYTGDNYPHYFQGKYLHGDWEQGWMMVIEFDDDDYTPTEIKTVFVPGTTPSSVLGIVDMAAHPITGDLYVIKYAYRILRMDWEPTGNQLPTAVAMADVEYGPGPLAVNFTGSDSTDPEDDSGDLIYRWDFGDESAIDNDPDPLHVFNAPAGVPTSYTVTLGVEDTMGFVSQASLLISVNNSPPQINITSPSNGDLYSVFAATQFNLDAIVTDNEHSAAELTCEWETRLYHDQHYHVELSQSACTAVGTTEPVGCEDVALYWFGFLLRVTDDAGLMSEQEILVYPDCSSFTLAPVTFDDNGSLDQGDSLEIEVLANDIYLYGAIDPTSVAEAVSPAHGTTSVDPVTGQITYTHDGSTANTDVFSYTVMDTEGDESPPANVYLAISIDCPADVTTQGAGIGDPGYGFPDGVVTGADISYYVNLWIAGDLASDMTTQGAGVGNPGFGMPDGIITAADIAFFVNLWIEDCS